MECSIPCPSGQSRNSPQPVSQANNEPAGGMDKTLVSAGDPALVRVMVVFAAYCDIF